MFKITTIGFDYVKEKRGRLSRASLRIKRSVAWQHGRQVAAAIIQQFYPSVPLRGRIFFPQAVGFILASYLTQIIFQNK